MALTNIRLCCRSSRRLIFGGGLDEEEQRGAIEAALQSLLDTFFPTIRLKTFLCDNCLRIFEYSLFPGIRISTKPGPWTTYLLCYPTDCES